MWPNALCSDKDRDRQALEQVCPITKCTRMSVALISVCSWSSTSAPCRCTSTVHVPVPLSHRHLTRHTSRKRKGWKAISLIHSLQLSLGYFFRFFFLPIWWIQVRKERQWLLESELCGSVAVHHRAAASSENRITPAVVALYHVLLLTRSKIIWEKEKGLALAPFSVLLAAS